MYAFLAVAKLRVIVFQVMCFTSYTSNNKYYCCFVLCLLLFTFVIFLARIATTYSTSSIIDNFVHKQEAIASMTDKVWPATDEKDDRIQSQLKLGYKLAEYIRTHKKIDDMKTILVPHPRDLWEPFVIGNQLFKDYCPITNCLLTNNIQKFNRTADAVILSVIRPQTVRRLQPKPKKQVIYL